DHNSPDNWVHQISSRWLPWSARYRSDRIPFRKIPVAAKALAGRGSGPPAHARADQPPAAIVNNSELDEVGRANLVFVPAGFNEDAIRAAGLSLIVVHDRTDAVAGITSRWGAARERHAEVIERQEGADWFARRQRVLPAAAELAGTRRLSRFLFL